MKQYFFLLVAVFLIFFGAVSAYGAPPGVSIANVRIVEGNAGQRSVEVLVILSQVPTNPVSLTYTSGNGSATAGSDYVAANGSLSFARGENQKKIIVSINGDLGIEANETFEIILRNGSGATLLDSISTITIVNDDFISGAPPVYEVRFTHTGYTTFAGTPADCPIRSNGKVVLTGLLSGAENVGPDDDIRYTGVLDLSIDMDICSSKPVGLGDEFKVCGMTVIGQGPVKTELEIYYDQRGGYIKIENESGDFLKFVFGTCDQLQQSEEENKMVPNKTIASIFNGRDLPKLTHRTLTVGQYIERDGENETVVDVLRKIKQ